jgi:hypothetical protein
MKSAVGEEDDSHYDFLGHIDAAVVVDHARDEVRNTAEIS